MRIVKSNGASLTLFVSIWLGILVVSMFMDGSEFLNQATDALTLISENPIMGIVDLIYKAFTNTFFGNTLLGGMLVAGGMAYGAVSGNSFFVFFAVPLFLILQLTSIFTLPTASFTSDSLDVGVTADIGTGPADSGWQMIKTVYAMFMGALVLLTILSFVSGRA